MTVTPVRSVVSAIRWVGILAGKPSQQENVDGIMDGAVSVQKRQQREKSFVLSMVVK